MPVAKLRASGVPDAIKSEVGNDSLDTFVRQAIGKEPLLPFSRIGENPVQWVQLFHALDQQDLLVWPLLTPVKVQMQKCDKCNKEFCSPINYRRHIRVHRRSLNVKKELYTNRDLLGEYWDKLAGDEANRVLSFKDVNLEEVPGSTVIRALTSFVRKPGFCVFPHVYLRAGSMLLDIIQGRTSSLPLSSQELFSVLDDASEGTFLSAGSAESIQKYIFDGKAGKVGLETKNVVAWTSFLIEQKLVKAWLAAKDAEALRCQMLLVEEEEAAQRRQAALLERRREKKLRQKEQKSKEHTNGEDGELHATVDTSESNHLEEPPSPPSMPESDFVILDISSVDIPVVQLVQDEDVAVQSLFNAHVGLPNNEDVKSRVVLQNDYQHIFVPQWQVAKANTSGQNGFYSNQNFQIMKPGSVQKCGPAKDPRVAQVVNTGRVWTKKSKTEKDVGVTNQMHDINTLNQSAENNCEVMIGSICVSGRSSSLVVAQDNSYPEQEFEKMGYAWESQVNIDAVPFCGNGSAGKLWRPIRRHKTRSQVPVQSGNQESRGDLKMDGADDRTIDFDNCQQSCHLDYDSCIKVDSSHLMLEENVQSKILPFSSQVAKSYLAQRWEEAISGDHARLVLSPELEPLSRCPKGECQLEASESDFQELPNSGNVQNQPASGEPSVLAATSKITKTNLRAQPEKGVSTKYIPKQKIVR